MNLCTNFDFKILWIFHMPGFYFVHSHCCETIEITTCNFNFNIISPSMPVRNSYLPSAACMHQWIGSALVQIMACRLDGARQLSELMLTYYSMKFYLKLKYFHSRKCAWIRRLQNGGRFVQGEMSWLMKTSSFTGIQFRQSNEACRTLFLSLTLMVSVINDSRATSGSSRNCGTV